MNTSIDSDTKNLFLIIKMIQIQQEEIEAMKEEVALLKENIQIDEAT